jgi:hypothetical protein
VRGAADSVAGAGGRALPPLSPLGRRDSSGGTHKRPLSEVLEPHSSSLNLPQHDAKRARAQHPEGLATAQGGDAPPSALQVRCWPLDHEGADGLGLSMPPACVVLLFNPPACTVCFDRTESTLPFPNLHCVNPFLYRRCCWKVPEERWGWGSSLHC